MADVEMDSASDDSAMEDYDEQITEVKKKLLDDDRSIPLANRMLMLLRKNGDFEELEIKRKEYVKWAPLNAANWVYWLQDAIEKNQVSAEEFDQMFQRALFDENDVAIWVKRIFFTKKLNLEAARELCEQALTAIGGRYDSGGHVWLIYLDLETERLKTLKDTPNFARATSHVISLYQRALRCATTQLEEVLENAEQFCEEFQQQDQLPELKKLFDGTMKLKKQLDQFETIIEVPTTKKQGLKRYLEFEVKSGMPARVQNAHERMVSEFHDDENAWSAYGEWTDTTLKLPKISVQVYKRAIRHCPYSFVLHQQALLAFERAKMPDEQIDELWEKAKHNIIKTHSTAEEGRDIYRTYVFLLRRRIVAAGSNDFSPMSEIFDEGAAILKEWFSMSWDADTVYRRMQAYFYASVMSDINKARNIWKEILGAGDGRFAARWIEVVRLERQFGDKEHARQYLTKALNSVSDNINEIYTYYIQYEREVGTLADLDSVLEKINSQVAHRASRPQKKEKVVVVKPKVAVVASGGEPTQKKVKKDGGFKAPLPPTTLKRPSPSSLPSSATSSSSSSSSSSSTQAPPPPVTSSAPAPPPAPAPESKALPGTEDARTVFISNLDFTTTEDDVRQALEGVASVRFARKAHSEHTHRGFAYVVLETEQLARKAIAKDRVPVRGRPMFVSINDPEKRTKFKYATGLEKSKVFVRNVNFQATDEELQTLFSKFGPIASVRRVTHRDGKPKGMAYIEFSNESDAQKCVSSTEPMMLRERELSVALSDPPRKTTDGSKGGVKKVETDGPRLGHAAKLQLLPRALAAKPAALRSDAMDTSEPSSSTNQPKKSLSNEQFRQMLMKK